VTSKRVLSVACAATAAALVVAGAGAKTVTPIPRTVKAGGKEVFSKNKFLRIEYHFSPGTISVASGARVTWKNTLKDEPHTITLSTEAGLPKSAEEDGCGNVCKVASGHLKNPKNPDAGIKTNVLDKGPAGLDEVGDSLALLPKKSISAKISAPAGTTLYYACAVHPWMQGEIKVIG
jgi:plastocyanin